MWALTLAAVLMGGCLAALAQDKMAAGDEGDVAARLQKLGKELNLTDDQKAKLKPILQSQGDDWRAVHNDASMTPQQKRMKMKEIHDKYAPQINEVLTPEQQAKWKQMKQEAWEKHKEGMNKPQ
jgi:Spy/CpxP family protein refolding chaperone